MKRKKIMSPSFITIPRPDVYQAAVTERVNRVLAPVVSNIQTGKVHSSCNVKEVDWDHLSPLDIEVHRKQLDDILKQADWKLSEFNHAAPNEELVCVITPHTATTTTEQQQQPPAPSS